MSQITKIFNYNPPAPTPTIWLRADKGVTKDGSDLVSLWEDYSGNNYDASQSTSGNKPLYVPNTLNSKPVLRFDGVDDFMDITSLNCLPNQSIISVFRKTGNRMFPIGDGNTTYFGYESQFLFAAYTVDQTPYYSIGPSITDFMLFSSVNNLNYTTIYKNSIKLNTNPIQNTGSYGSLTKIGRTFSNVQYSTGDIAEIMVYNSALSDTERTIVESYLKTKYAL